MHIISDTIAKKIEPFANAECKNSAYLRQLKLLKWKFKNLAKLVSHIKLCHKGIMYDISLWNIEDNF